MQYAFYLSMVSFALLWVTLWRFEIVAKHVAAEMRRLRRTLGEEADELPTRRSAAPSLTHAGSST
jgi:hypothetical protein